MKQVLALMLAILLLACAGCAMNPDTPAQPEQPSPANRPLYTVDIHPEGPMLYPVLSKAVPFNPYGGWAYYPDMGYSANSFKLVNEGWEDITGYINGSYEYVYVNGEVYGIQIREYEPSGEVHEYEPGDRHAIGLYGEPYILGLDGRPIPALDGLIAQKPHYCFASLPEGLLYVTTAEAYNTAAEIEWGMWPDVGIFNTKTGKLQIPVEYTQLILLEDTALGVKDGVMYKLDYEGKVLATLGEDWWISDFYDGDDLLRVNDTTYIDRSGQVALALSGVRGASNFRGEYAWGWLGEPDDDYVEPVFIDRQGRRVGDKTYLGINSWYDGYYVAISEASSKVLDLSLQAVYTTGEEGVNDIIDGMLLTVLWNDDMAATTTVSDIRSGDEIFSIEGYPWYENGFFIVADNGLYTLYGMDGKLIFDNARVMKIAGDGKFIYVDNGKHMGYIDAKGDWVYRINAAYYNLED